jgi:hypothetical protein
VAPITQVLQAGADAATGSSVWPDPTQPCPPHAATALGHGGLWFQYKEPANAGAEFYPPLIQAQYAPQTRVFKKFFTKFLHRFLHLVGRNGQSAKKHGVLPKATHYM